MHLEAGSLIGQYEIRSFLGKGGMGEVYLAHDSRLRRPVALKLLPPEFAADRERLLRFKQEAYAASSLNHPSIVTIYGVEHDGPQPYIAMEYVEGETLRQRLGRSHLTTAEALAVATRVAEALEAAHSSGIVHRDLKPENIMLRSDGYLKVLDFGLAKLCYEAPTQPELALHGAPTLTNVYTDQGRALGTSRYMAPEQLRGLEVDRRCDLWGLGVVLYEMLAPGQPFKGHTTGEVIVSILERDPEPLSPQNLEISDELQRVVMRALAKHREERYQTAREMLEDMRRCSRGLSASEPGRAAMRAPHAARAAAETAPVEGAAATNPVGPATNGKATAGSRPGEDVRPRFRLGRLRWAALSLTAALAAAVFYLGYWSAFGSMWARALKGGKVQRLALTGHVREAAVSPDGKYLVTVVEESGRRSLSLRELSTSADARIVPPSEARLKGVAFSPDGGYVYFLEEEGESAVLFRVPKLGGTPRRLVQNVNTPVTFSPDGSRMAFVRFDQGARASILLTARPDGSDERPLAVRRPPDIFTLGGVGAGGPAWSPDGKVIACPTLSMAEPIEMNVVAVSADDGSQRRVNRQPWKSVEQLAWLADGSGLVMNAIDAGDSPYQIWLLSHPAGEVRRITNDPNFYEGISLTKDAATLVTTFSDRLSDIWVVGERPAEATRLPSSAQAGSNGLAWTAEGKLVYTLAVENGQELWLMGADGAGNRQLTFDLHTNIQPAVSGDGREVFFVSYRTGSAHIWRAEADGSNPRQLTFGRYEDTPQLSADGRWVVYHSIDPASDSVWRVPAGGGTPVLLTTLPSMQPALSPDGNWLACLSRAGGPNSPWRIALLPSGGGEVVRWLDPPASPDLAGNHLRWSPDGLSLTYVAFEGDFSNVWRVPLDGSAPSRVTDFKEDYIFSYAWSPDGKRLACARGRSARGVAVMKEE